MEHEDYTSPLITDEQETFAVRRSLQRFGDKKIIVKKIKVMFRR